MKRYFTMLFLTAVILSTKAQPVSHFIYNPLRYNTYYTTIASTATIESKFDSAIVLTAECTDSGQSNNTTYLALKINEAGQVINTMGTDTMILRTISTYK